MKKYLRIWTGLFCLLAGLALHSQSFGTFKGQPFTPVPAHDFADFYLDPPWTVGSPITFTQLTNSMVLGPQSGGIYLRPDGPIVCWHVASNADVTFPKPIRIGSRIISSTGTNWLRYNITNGATENIRFVKPPIGFGETLYTNSIIRLTYWGGVTNNSTANNLDLLQSDAGPWFVTQLLTGSGNAANTVGVWAHCGDGNSTNAVALTNFVPYFIEWRINHITKAASMTVRNANGTTNGVIVPTFTTTGGASWQISLQANYLNLGQVTGFIMVSGLSIDYTDQ